MSRSAPMRMSRATAFLDSCVLLEAKGPLFLSMVGKKEQTRGGFFIKPYSGSSVLPFINTAVFWFGTLKTQSNILAYETISSISPKVTDCSPAKHSTWSKGVIGKLLTANTRQTSAAITLSMGMWIRTWDWNWAQKNTSIYLFNEGKQWIPNTVDDSKKLQTLWVKASKTYNSSSWGTAGAFIALSPDRIDTFCFWRYVAMLGSLMFANSDLLNFVQSLLDTRTRFPMGHPERSIQFLTSLI